MTVTKISVSWCLDEAISFFRTQDYGVTTIETFVNTITSTRCVLPVMTSGQKVTLYSAAGMTVYAPEGTTISGGATYIMAAGETQTFYSAGQTRFTYTPKPTIPTNALTTRLLSVLTTRQGSILTTRAA